MTQASGDTGGAVEAAQISVETDDIVSGCVRHLLSFSDVTDMVPSSVVGEEAYIFQWTLQMIIETTQSSAVVVSQVGSWAAPNIHNTLKFPRISVEFYADPLRDNGRNYTDLTEVRRRINALYNAVDKRLHRPQAGEQMWGSIRTLECTRLGEPVIYEIPNGDGALRGQVFYGVVVG